MTTKTIRAVIRWAGAPGGLRRGKSYLAQCDVGDVPGVGKPFPGPPGTLAYTVEYTLSNTGRYNVVAPYDAEYCVASVSDRKSRKRWPVCFLPEAWWGKRVDREVVADTRITKSRWKRV